MKIWGWGMGLGLINFITFQISFYLQITCDFVKNNNRSVQSIITQYFTYLLVVDIEI
jgi:hypothetical protein